MLRCRPRRAGCRRRGSQPVRCGHCANSFTDFERENEDLRRRMTAGAAVIEVDPTLIDPSPVQDRFADQDDAVLRRTQSVDGAVRAGGPRPHPRASDGARALPDRIRPSTRASGAGNRPAGEGCPAELTDQELIVAQGLENSAREDLSFIERAVFAMTLEEAGYDRSVVQAALSVDRAEASKLVAVAPQPSRGDLVERIGRAPKVGRGRWLTSPTPAREAGALAAGRPLAGGPELPAHGRPTIASSPSCRGRQPPTSAASRGGAATIPSVTRAGGASPARAARAAR